MDPSHHRLVDDLEMENIPKHQPTTRKGRVSCEVNSIGATGVWLPLLGRITICIGARIVQPAQK